MDSFLWTTALYQPRLFACSAEFCLSMQDLRIKTVNFQVEKHFYLRLKCAVRSVPMFLLDRKFESIVDKKHPGAAFLISICSRQ